MALVSKAEVLKVLSRLPWGLCEKLKQHVHGMLEWSYQVLQNLADCLTWEWTPTSAKTHTFTATDYRLPYISNQKYCNNKHIPLAIYPALSWGHRMLHPPDQWPLNTVQLHLTASLGVRSWSLILCLNQFWYLASVATLKWANTFSVDC